LTHDKARKDASLTKRRDNGGSGRNRDTQELILFLRTALEGLLGKTFGITALSTEGTVIAASRTIITGWRMLMRGFSTPQLMQIAGLPRW
jgi:hypothetical protein